MFADLFKVLAWMKDKYKESQRGPRCEVSVRRSAYHYFRYLAKQPHFPYFFVKIVFWYLIFARQYKIFYLEQN